MKKTSLYIILGTTIIVLFILFQDIFTSTLVRTLVVLGIIALEVLLTFLSIKDMFDYKKQLACDTDPKIIRYNVETYDLPSTNMMQIDIFINRPPKQRSREGIIERITTFHLIDFAGFAADVIWSIKYDDEMLVCDEQLTDKDSLKELIKKKNVFKFKSFDITYNENGESAKRALVERDKLRLIVSKNEFPLVIESLNNVFGEVVL